MSESINTIKLMLQPVVSTTIGLSITATAELEHPLMRYLRNELLLIAVSHRYKSWRTDISSLYNHLRFLKEEYEINNRSKYPDVAMVYSHAHCCGHSIVVKKGEQEIRVRYNPGI